MKKERNKKVFVGLSGGVDSSVSAALLQEQGFDVTGVFIKVWQPDFLPCNWKQDRLDAMRVCAKLGISFLTLDLEKEYKEGVVDYMIAEYKAGRTPNPDVMCNRYVKFGGFFKWAMEQGADYVATGHYARVGKNKKAETELFAGRDQNKDQSYFLWTLTQKELSRTLFPVGNIEKPEVRKLAKKFGLVTAEKKDSQGLCFVGKVDMKEFLKHYLNEKSGDVLNEKSEVIGSHEGAFFYTIGERHGFTVVKKTPHDGPYYVVAKNLEKNTITVSQKEPGEILKNEKIITLSKTSWTRELPMVGKKYQARIRYRAPLESCTLEQVRVSHARFVFETAQNAVTPGQSLVLYDGDECLGGGIIE